ncbi:MAG: vitamin K epoxide reductase family protein [Chloroflexi bacterium]|nr:vitamin K epoxide reductase family protein [Chloroflexota bacterium]
MKKSLIVLAGIGLLDALYLTWIKLANQQAMCAGIGNCEVVNSSQYAELAGMPIALFGASAYLLILVLLLLEDRTEFLSENGPMLIFGFSLAGVLYSAYLTYIEIYVLRAICPFCVLSAIVLVALLALSWLRIRGHWVEA